MEDRTQHHKSVVAAGERVNGGVMLPAPELCMVKVVGEGALGSVGSGGDR